MRALPQSWQWNSVCVPNCTLLFIVHYLWPELYFIGNREAFGTRSVLHWPIKGQWEEALKWTDGSNSRYAVTCTVAALGYTSHRLTPGQLRGKRRAGRLMQWLVHCFCWFLKIALEAFNCLSFYWLVGVWMNVLSLVIETELRSMWGIVVVENRFGSLSI